MPIYYNSVEPYYTPTDYNTDKFNECLIKINML